MKKKGLIVATIVMVLVLAVSLTTATYAWFNANQAASVDKVQVSVASASNISIGVLADPSLSATTATSYVSGTELTYTEAPAAANQGKGLGTFASAESTALTTNNGLGTKVSWDWSLSSIGGVSSSSNGTAFDSPYNAANKLYNGSLVDGEAEVVGLATYNVATNLSASPDPIICSVIYAPFGLRVEKDNLNYLYCDITIEAENASFWGIVAALKLEITGDHTWSGHPFHASTGTVADGLMSSLNKYNTAPPSGKKVTFRFVIAKNTTTKLANGPESTIYSFKIRMFLDGEDASCIADATQYNASISLSFDALNSSDFGNLTAATATTDLTAA